MDWAKTTARRGKKHLKVRFGATYIRYLTVLNVKEINNEAIIAHPKKWWSFNLQLYDVFHNRYTLRDEATTWNSSIYM